MSLVITGASGQLGAYLLRGLRGRNLPVVAWSGSRRGDVFGLPLWPVDLTDPDRVAKAFEASRPSLIVHLAAVASVAACFRDPALAERVNTQGTVLLAELAARARARFLFVSTDLVFDGEQGWYREQDTPAPLSVYASTKAAAERAVLAHPGGLVVRTGLLFGPSLVSRPWFFDEQVTALRAGKPCVLFEDEWRSPLALPVAAQALLELAHSEVSGVVHLGGPERLSRLEMGQRLAAYLGSNPALIVPAKRNQVAGAEPRPRDTSLDATRWRQLFPHHPWPTFDESLRDMALPGVV